MALSVYKTILDAVLNAVTGLGLTFNGNVVPVILRKPPSAEQGLASLPSIVVTPTPRPERVENWSSENRMLVVYAATVTVIGPGNRDFTDTNLDVWFLFREQARRALQGVEQLAAPSVFRTEVLPDVPLDPQKLNTSYDYSACKFLFHSVEPRTN